MRKSINKKEREKIFQKYNGHCAYCGKKIEYKDMQVDHLIPVRREECCNDFENLMPSCRSCNHYKRAHDLEVWREMLEEIPKKLERDSYIYRVGINYNLMEAKPHQVVFYFEKFNNNI